MPFEVPDEAFMVLALQPGALKGVSGVVQFHPAFGEGQVWVGRKISEDFSSLRSSK